MKNLLLAVILATVIVPMAEAKTQRNPAVVRQFRKTHICPSTGKYSQKCQGYVVDHLIGLCKGGSDSVGNMQYQTIKDAKAKDRWECK